MIFKPRSQELKPEDQPAPTPDMVERSMFENNDRIMKQLEKKEEKAKTKAAMADSKKTPDKKWMLFVK